MGVRLKRGGEGLGRKRVLINLKKERVDTTKGGKTDIKGGEKDIRACSTNRDVTDGKHSLEK